MLIEDMSRIFAIHHYYVCSTVCGQPTIQHKVKTLSLWMKLCTCTLEQCKHSQC